MKIKSLLLLLLSLCMFLITHAQQIETVNYRYNKVYDYENDTLPTKPFHLDSLVHFAKKLIGSPYLSPGRTPSGFDCSGFAFYCFREYGIYLPYFSHEQATLGKEIPASEAKNGDLIFFQGHDINDKSVHHVGILVNKKGEKLRFIHSASHGVQYDNIDNPYYQPRFITIKRVY